MANLYRQTVARMSPALKSIHVEGIDLYMPADWQMPPGKTVFLGPAGLLDARMNVVGNPISENRLEEIRMALESRNAEVQLLRLQGTDCIRSRYRQNTALVVSYWFRIDSEQELAAVYVFRPGYENLADAVDERLQTAGPI
jgi:hypothetical protein